MEEEPRRTAAVRALLYGASYLRSWGVFPRRVRVRCGSVKIEEGAIELLALLQERPAPPPVPRVEDARVRAAECRARAQCVTVSRARAHGGKAGQGRQGQDRAGWSAKFK